MQTHAVDLFLRIPMLLDFLHVYPSQPDAILFHLKRDNHSRQSQHISVHRRCTAYFQRMAVFQTSDIDFIGFYVIQNISGFEG